MSTRPRLEARVTAQERRQNDLDARVEELSEDITANFKHLTEDMTASFKAVTDYVITTQENAENRFNKIEADIADVKATMATKDDITDIKTAMAAMESRILDAFKQLLTTINPQHPPTE